MKSAKSNEYSMADISHYSDALSLHSGVLIADCNGVITWVNDEYCSILDFDRQSLIDGTHSFIDVELNPATLIVSLWKTIKAGQVWKGELRSKKENGDSVWLQTTIVPYVDDNNQPYCYVVMVSEIIAFRLPDTVKIPFSEDDLSRDLILSLLDDFNILQLPAGEAFSQLLKRASSMSGFNRAYLLRFDGEQKNLRSLCCYPRQEQQTNEIYHDYWNAEAALSENKLVTIDIVCDAARISPELHSHLLMSNTQLQIIAPVFKNYGIIGIIVCEYEAPIQLTNEKKKTLRAISSLCAFLIDYYDQEDIRQQLAISENRLAQCLSLGKIGSWDWVLDTGEVYWSEQVGYMLGHNDSIPETTFEEFFSSVHSEDQAMVEAKISACINEGEDYDIEFRVISPEDTIRWISASGYTAKDENGKPIRMMGVVKDVTEKVNFEQELIQARDKAEKASHAKSEFLSRMSHELRTPLNAILGFAQLLEIDHPNHDPDDVKLFAREILGAGRHLLELIDEVLDLAKVESGKIGVEALTFKLKTLLQECLHLTLPLFKKRNIKVNYISDDDAGDVLVCSDRKRIKQVVVNLLSNAAKYSVANGVVEFGFKKSHHDTYRIFVKDHGPGIPRSLHDRLFETFDRLSAEGAEIEGTGIGLAISKKLLQLLKTQLNFTSEPEVGSEFWFDLKSDTDSVDELQQINNSPEMELIDGAQLQVLYIEDNMPNVMLVRKILGRIANVKLLDASIPQIGLELASTYKPDLILLDLKLPVMSGFEVLKHLRQNPETAEIPVIAVTANAMTHDVERCQLAGFDDYLSKPFDIDIFYSKVNSYLNRKLN